MPALRDLQQATLRAAKATAAPFCAQCLAKRQALATRGLGGAQQAVLRQAKARGAAFCAECSLSRLANLAHQVEKSGTPVKQFINAASQAAPGPLAAVTPTAESLVGGVLRQLRDRAGPGSGEIGRGAIGVAQGLALRTAKARGAPFCLTCAVGPLGQIARTASAPPQQAALKSAKARGAPFCAKCQSLGAEGQPR